MILVSGGTGLIGSHLLLQLLRANEVVRAIHRRGSNLEYVREVFSYYTDQADELYERIQWQEADVTDIKALENAFKGVRLVYHCAAYISFDKANFRKLKQSNVEGTANIVNIALANKVEKLCYVSSIATLGPPDESGVVTEESSWDYSSANPYAITKHQAEMEVWRGNQEGLDTVIVNPGVVIGPGFWNKGSGAFFSWAAGGMRFYLPGSTGFITVNDVVKIMIELMESPISGERFILVDKNLSFKELLSNIAREFGHRPPNHRIRLWQLQLFRAFDWLRKKLFGGGRKITGAQISALSRNPEFSNARIVKTLDYEFELLAQAIYFTCNRFKEAHPRMFS